MESILHHIQFQGSHKLQAKEGFSALCQLRVYCPVIVRRYLIIKVSLDVERSEFICPAIHLVSYTWCNGQKQQVLSFHRALQEALEETTFCTVSICQALYRILLPSRSPGSVSYAMTD